MLERMANSSVYSIAAEQPMHQFYQVKSSALHPYGAAFYPDIVCGLSSLLEQNPRLFSIPNLHAGDQLAPGDILVHESSGTAGHSSAAAGSGSQSEVTVVPDHYRRTVRSGNRSPKHPEFEVRLRWQKITWCWISVASP